MKKFFFIAGILFILLDVSIGSVLALSVSPLELTFDTAQGQKDQKSVVLSNQSATDISVSPRLFAVTSTDIHGFPKIEPMTSGSVISELVSFPKGTSYVIPHKSTLEIPVQVTIPFFVKPGGYYLTIAWGAEKNRDGSIPVQDLPGVNVMIRVPGTTVHNAFIQHFGTTPNTNVLSGLPISFFADIKNDGGIDIEPTGVVSIATVFGKKIAEVPLLAIQNDLNTSGEREVGAVLPGSTRRFYATWKQGIALGIYTSTLNADFGSGMHGNAETSFVVIPYSFTVSAVALLILIAVFMVIRKKRKFFKT